MAVSSPPVPSPAQRAELLRALEARFHAHPQRHAGLEWAAFRSRLEAQPQAIRALHAMEASGGQPDVVGRDASTGAYLVFDCAPESPTGRRSLCYDPAALAARKENKPHGSALGLATQLGITLLSVEQYQHLQQLGAFDTKTSSWVLTPEPIRQQGGALFGDRRYGHVFFYHNGAESYYAARGFRGALRV